jgi:hypothetical protein
VSKGSICQSCNANGMGSFCPNCGERYLATDQRKMSVLFGQAFEELTSLDSKLFRTLRAFLLRPGFLSYEHWRGVRQPYMKPFTLFLMINLIYFFFSPLTDFTLPLDRQQLQPVYGDWLMSIIEGYLAESGRSLAELAEKYDVITSVVAKSIVVVGVPFFVPFVWMMNPPSKFYLIDHTVFALHAYCFFLAWPIMGAAVGATMFYVAGVTVAQGLPSILMALVPQLIYLSIAQKNMYGGPLWAVLLKGLFLVGGLVVSHFIYRFIQFWIVWWQVT